ncbi:general substrate transporter [Dipodascopsis tothii]|uniref:general substrate transporter n=1 Tax=Dipodascopsis tothii TaxID=44089 RepID=UPI0034CF281C
MAIWKYNVVHKLSERWLLIAINTIAGVSIFFFGYDQGMMSGVNNSPDYVAHMNFGYAEDDGTVVVTNSTRQGGIVAIYYFGTLLGSLLGGVLGDRLGRIKSIGIGCVWAIVGAALQCSAHNVAWMCCARIVNGVGTGVLNTIVPVYGAETADYKSRGQFIAMEFTLNIFGVVAAYWLEYGLSYIDGGFSAFRWRFSIAFQIIPLVFLLSAVWFFPESPRWLIKNGQNEDAKYILTKLRGTATDEAEIEYRDIVEIIEYERKTASRNSYLHMFFGIGSGDLHLGRRVQLVIWLQILQEWTGIAGVTVYQPTIFANAGFSTRKASWLSGVNNIFYMFSTLINAFTVDRIGRRWTMYWGAVGQGVAMFLAGGFSRLQIEHPENSAYGAAAASFVFIYTSVFGATWLIVPWLYPTEVFPLEVRAKGNAFGVFGWSIGNGWLTLLCPIMFDHIGEKTLYIFGAFNVFAVFVVWAFYPETSQLTLEEIDVLFSHPSPFVWKSRKLMKELRSKHDSKRVGAVLDRELGVSKQSYGETEDAVEMTATGVDTSSTTSKR